MWQELGWLNGGSENSPSTQLLSHVAGRWAQTVAWILVTSEAWGLSSFPCKFLLKDLVAECLCFLTQHDDEFQEQTSPRRIMWKPL